MGFNIKSLLKGAAKVADVALDVATAPVSIITSALPGKTGDMVKGGIGVLTGNPTLVMSAAAGLLSSSGDKKSGPKTELPPRTELRGNLPTGQRNPEGVRYDPKSHLDSNYPSYVSALRTLEQNWATFDCAGGRKDRVLTRQDLAAIKNNPHSSADLKKAASFLLQHPEYFNRLESAAYKIGPLSIGGSSDGRVSQLSLTAELASAKAELQRWGVRPPASSPHPVSPAMPQASKPASCLPTSNPAPAASMSANAKGCGGTAHGEPLKSLVAKGQGSVEDRALSVMGDMMKKLDGEFESLVAQMERGEGDSATLQFKLQQVMEKRSRMFNLMSTVSSKLNEMWNHSIQNMGKA